MTMPKIDNQTLELALFILVALAMLVQAIALLAVFFVMRKAAKSMTRRVEEVHAAALPLIETSRNLVIRLAPRIDSASQDVAAIASFLRAKTADFETAADDIVARARAQAGRLDAILTNFFDAMDRAGGFVADCINKPIRQLSALLAAAKAVVESLQTAVPAPRSRTNHAPGDSDMFI